MQPRRLLPARALQRERLAREVDRAERAALHRHDPQARRARAARRRHAQLTALLDHHQQRGRVQQREPAVGHQAQQPQLRSGQHAQDYAGAHPTEARATAERDSTSGPRRVATERRRAQGAHPGLLATPQRGGAGAREQFLAAAALAPRGQSHRYAQRAARPLRFHLDRAQPVQHAPRDHLAARAIRAGQHDQQLAIAGAPDPVEAAQLPPQRARDVAERLLAQRAAVLARHLIEVVDHHQQAAQLRAMAFGAVDLLLQALAQLPRRQPLHPSIGGTCARVGFVGSHAVRFDRGVYAAGGAPLLTQIMLARAPLGEYLPAGQRGRAEPPPPRASHERRTVRPRPLVHPLHAPRAACREPAPDRTRPAAPRARSECADGGDRGGQDGARARARPAARRACPRGDRAPGGERGLRRGDLRPPRAAARSDRRAARAPTRRSSCSRAA